MAAGEGSAAFRPEPPAPTIGPGELVALHVYLYRECVARELVDPRVDVHVVSTDGRQDVFARVGFGARGSRVVMGTTVARHLVPCVGRVAEEILRDVAAVDHTDPRFGGTG